MLNAFGKFGKKTRDETDPAEGTVMDAELSEEDAPPAEIADTGVLFVGEDADLSDEIDEDLTLEADGEEVEEHDDSGDEDEELDLEVADGSTRPGGLRGLLGRRRRAYTPADSDFAEEAGEPTADSSRSSAGGTGAKPMRKDERLSSVIGESEPGAAVELLRMNSRFALPDNAGWVIMVLPTQDPSFGGLNRRQKKDEDKGTIINLLINDDIHPVVTPDLLDDNALGLIPDESSMERMDEFAILRKARYMYGVVATDPDTGDLMVFLVPPKRRESSQGYIFDEVAMVGRGDLDLEEVVDFELVATMLEIFHLSDEEGDQTPYGADGVLLAMDHNMEAVAELAVRGEYPTSEQLVANLVHHFPRLASARHDVRARPLSGADASTPAETSPVTAVTDDHPQGEVAGTGVDGDADFGEREVAVDIEESNLGDDLGDEDEPDFDAFGEPYSTSSDIDYGDAEPNFFDGGDEGDEGVQVDPAAPGSTVSNVHLSDDQFAMLMDNVLQVQADVTSNRLDAVRSDILSMVSQQQQALGQVSERDDRSFDHNEVSQEAVRRYVNDDLGLFIDETVFNKTLTIAPRQLNLPTERMVTPWLGDQVRVLVEGLNGRLMEMRQHNYERLRGQYLKSMDVHIQAITDDLSLSNPESTFADLLEKIKADRKAMEDVSHDMSARQKAELKEAYGQRRERFAEAKVAEARADFDRSHLPQHLDEINRVDGRLRDLRNRANEENLGELNTYRRALAGERLNGITTEIIDDLAPLLEKQAEAERSAWEQAQRDIHKYIDEHRLEDIHQAQVTEQRLAADTRVEQILEESEYRIENMLRETEVQIEAKNAQLQRQEEEFKAEIARREQMVVEIEGRTQKQQLLAQSDTEAAKARFEARVAEIQADSEARVQAERERAEQAKVNSDEFIQAQRREDKTQMFYMVVIFVVALIAGILFGVSFM